MSMTAALSESRTLTYPDYRSFSFFRASPEPHEVLPIQASIIAENLEGILRKSEYRRDFDKISFGHRKAYRVVIFTLTNKEP